jgi:hypothetical protein
LSLLILQREEEVPVSMDDTWVAWPPVFGHGRTYVDELELPSRPLATAATKGSVSSGRGGESGRNSSGRGVEAWPKFVDEFVPRQRTTRESSASSSRGSVSGCSYSGRGGEAGPKFVNEFVHRRWIARDLHRRGRTMMGASSIRPVQRP